MDHQMKTVTATGSFVSMFALSFLAVFREGAETILFYVGIIPRITTANFFDWYWFSHCSSCYHCCSYD